MPRRRKMQVALQNRLRIMASMPHLLTPPMVKMGTPRGSPQMCPTFIWTTSQNHVQTKVLVLVVQQMPGWSLSPPTQAPSMRGLGKPHKPTIIPGAPHGTKTVRTTCESRAMGTPETTILWMLPTRPGSVTNTRKTVATMHSVSSPRDMTVDQVAFPLVFPSSTIIVLELPR